MSFSVQPSIPVVLGLPTACVVRSMLTSNARAVMLWITCHLVSVVLGLPTAAWFTNQLRVIYRIIQGQQIQA